MASLMPFRLLSRVKEDFSVIDLRTHTVKHFDIIFYGPGSKVPSCQYSIDDVDWDVDVHPKVFGKIKSSIIHAEANTCGSNPSV